MVVRSCDAKCDAISADRVELLARAVILLAGMAIPEAAREAVLARVVADLTANDNHMRGAGSRSRRVPDHVQIRPPDPRVGAAPGLVMARAVEGDGIEPRRLG